MRKRVLITGSNGLLGQKLVHQLRNTAGVDLLATSKGNNRISTTEGYNYSELDITDPSQIQDIFKEFQPHAVINTAAMTNVDACESNKALCDILNVDAVQYLCDASVQHNSHLVHLSTDFVFDGKSGPYSEEETPAPLSYYGQSKVRSETIVKNAGLKHWSIARTIIVYGVAEQMSRSNIVLWAKQALEGGQPLTIVDDQFRMPTLAEDLANGCICILKKEANGIYHLSGKDFMSILELVQRVAKHFKLPTTQITPIKSSVLNQAAQRPPKTGFVLAKAMNDLEYAPHSFEEGLAILEQQL